MDPARPWVAVLDDEECVRRALERLLRSAGFEVKTFASGSEFLDSLVPRLPGCLVLDIHMRGMTGFDVLAALKTRDLMVPVIVITAYEDETAEPRAMRAGASQFMRKPIRDEDLLHAVETALRSCANGAALT